MTGSMELLVSQGTIREMGEGSNKVNIRSNSISTNLIKVGMTSTSASKCMTSFRLLAEGWQC